MSQHPGELTPADDFGLGDVEATRENAEPFAARPAEILDSGSPARFADFDGSVGIDINDGGDGQPARGHRRAIISAVATGAVVALVAGGAFAFNALSGGGAQPEDVLPGTAFAFVKLDLDPSAGQKIALARLAQKFPEMAKDSDTAALMDGDALSPVIERWLGKHGAEVNEKTDLKPWVGDRLGLAISPGPVTTTDPVGINYVFAVAVSDKAQAETVLKRAQADSKAADKSFVYAFSGDYVLLAPEQDDLTQATSAVDSGKTLAKNEQYADDLASLENDQFAATWVDLGTFSDIGRKLATTNSVKGMSLNADVLRNTALAGTVIVGAHAAAGYLEFQLKSSDLVRTTGGVSATPLAPIETTLAADAPGDATVAVSFAGLGDVMSTAYPQLIAQQPDLEKELAGYGLHLPDDFATILGTDIGFYSRGTPSTDSGVVVVKGGDPAKVKELAARVGQEVATMSVGDTSYYALNQSALPNDALLAAQKLGGTESYKKAVPDAGGYFAAYGNISGLAAGDAAYAHAFVNAEALGLSASVVDGDIEVRIRLTVN